MPGSCGLSNQVCERSRRCGSRAGPALVGGAGLFMAWPPRAPDCTCHLVARPWPRQSLPEKMPSMVASAADLKFLHHLQQTRLGTSNRKAALESQSCQCPPASEARVKGCRDVSRASEAGHLAAG